MWVENIDGNAESLVGFGQFFSNKAATMLQSMILVACSVRAVLLTVSSKRRQRLQYNGQTLIGYLPICRPKEELEEHEGANDEDMSVYGSTSSRTVPFEGVVLASADSKRRERQMRVIYEATKEVARALHKCRYR